MLLIVVLFLFLFLVCFLAGLLWPFSIISLIMDQIKKVKPRKKIDGRPEGNHLAIGKQNWALTSRVSLLEN